MSLTKKAIQLTEDTKREVQQQYFEDDRLDELLGYWFVTGFGQFGRADYEILGPTVFKQTYIPTGKKLENGYVEVIERPEEAMVTPPAP